MKLEWMGRYRDIISKIMRHGNLYARTYTDKLTDTSGIILSSLEWQTLECILEFEDENYNMATLANIIGIPQSNFSKYVKTLLDKNLIERFKKKNNNKDIVLKLTNLGISFYDTRSKIILSEWSNAFIELENFSDAELASFSIFLSKLTESFDPTKNSSSNLIKL